MVSTGWTWRQPTIAGCSTVRTLMGRRRPAEQHHSTGEAADIRRRGGHWRASRPAGPRSVRAGRRELPPPTGPRRCPHEQRDSRLARGIPALSMPGGRQELAMMSTSWIPERKAVRQKLHGSREVVGCHVNHVGVQRITIDRHANRRHVHPELVRSSSARGKSVQAVSDVLD